MLWKLCFQKTARQAEIVRPSTKYKLIQHLENGLLISQSTKSFLWANRFQSYASKRGARFPMKALDFFASKMANFDGFSRFSVKPTCSTQRLQVYK